MLKLSIVYQTAHYQWQVGERKYVPLQQFPTYYVASEGQMTTLSSCHSEHCQQSIIVQAEVTLQ